MPNLIRTAFFAIAGVLAIGCGSATAPNGVTPAQLARHIDSLTAAATLAAPYGWRPFYLSEVEALPANGAAAVSVLIRTEAGTQTWKGFVLKSTVHSYDTGPDSIYHLLAYSDFNLTNVLLVQQEFWPMPYSMQLAGYLLADTVLASFGSGTMTVASTSIGRACSRISGLVYYSYSYAPPTTCSLATFTAGFSLTWPKTPGVDPNLLTMSVTTQTFGGLVLQ